MALETIPIHNDLFNMILYEAMYSTHHGCYSGDAMESAAIAEQAQTLGWGSSLMPSAQFPAQVTAKRRANFGVPGRSKSRRKPRTCKNKEDAETQRMTHIAVERNRRKQMNEHLAVLRSLMPESYAQRGDQASIVGGAIEYVKELEHLVHSLEAQKLMLLQAEQTQVLLSSSGHHNDVTPSTTTSPLNTTKRMMEFFSNPQCPASLVGNKYTLKSNPGVGDIEVILIESHANLRILSKNNPRLLRKLVSGFQALLLSILHLNVTSLGPLILYSISAKVEEGCELTTTDGIADALHHMLRLIIEQDAASLLLKH